MDARFSGVLISILAVAPLAAQGASAQVAGRIQDTQGNPLADATLTLRNEETGLVRTLTSDASGAFLTGALPVGPYALTASLDGYETVAGIRVTLTLTGSAPLTVTLTKQGQGGETALPAGDLERLTHTQVVQALNLDRRRVEEATDFSPEFMVQLPLKGRSFLDFAQLAPQVQLSDTPGHSPLLALAGQRGINSSIAIDGAEFNDPFFHGYVGSTTGRNPYTLSLEAVREFQVVTDGASAEWGRMGGGYLNAVTKSGTNTFSGALFYFTRPEDLVAREAATARVADFDTKQFGGSVGGPILKDRLFYFVAFDSQRESRPTPFAWDAPLDPSIPSEAVLLSKGGPYGTRADSDTVFVRFDWNPSPEHSFQLRLNHSRYTGDFNVARDIAFEATGEDRIRTFMLAGEWNYLPRTDWNQNLRFAYVQDDQPRDPRTLSPQVVIGGVGTYGNYPYTRDFDDKRYQLTEVLTYQRPDFQAKAGLDYNQTRFYQVFAPFQAGSYFFNNLQAFDAGQWATYTQAFGLNGLSAQEAGTFGAVEREYAAFVEGSWHLGSAVWLRAGLRWDRQEHPGGGIPDTTQRLAPVIPLTGHVPDDAQWSPRLSFTYSPDWDQQRSVLRGSWGIYVSRTPQIDTIAAFLQNGRQVGQYTFAGSAGAPLPWGPGFSPADPAVLSSLPSGAQAGQPTLFSFDPGFRNPRTTRANLSWERLFGTWQLGLSTTYAKTMHLERRNDLNLGDPTPDAEGRLVFGPRPNPAYGRFLVFTSDAEALYRAMTVSAKYQPDDSPLQLQAYYTLSYAKDNDSNERLYLDDPVQNPQRLGDQWGWGDLDRRHMLTLFATTEEPHTGLKLGLTYRYLSARPYTLTNPVDLNHDGLAGNDRLLGTDRNGFRTGPQTTLDAKVSRGWALGRISVTFSVEVYNLLDRHDTYARYRFQGTDADPAVTSTPTPLYTVDSTLFPTRQVQFGARIEF